MARGTSTFGSQEMQRAPARQHCPCVARAPHAPQLETGLRDHEGAAPPSPLSRESTPLTALPASALDSPAHLTAAPPAAHPARARVDSVDVLRGTVMILMALDHTRDFFGVPGVNPTDPANTALFLTRWITHFCAPVFFLLTGTSAFLSRQRWPGRGLSRYLITRGALLVLLELTVVRTLSYQFNVDYRVTMLLVIWALGWSMIVLGALMRLPVRAILAIGLVMIAGHNLLDGIRSANPLWSILHGPGFVLQGKFTVFAAYPLVPWIGVTAVGYALGAIFEWPAAQRRRVLLQLGAAAIALFLMLRAFNVYGDPAPWTPQATAVATTLSFFNTSKYPPSLLFLLMTLGPALLVLRAVDGGVPGVLRPTIVYGRVPLFYFILHFTLIHLAAVVVCLAINGAAHWMFESPSLDKYPFTPPPGWGFSLPVVYLVWLGVVASLYPACRWYARLKGRRGGVVRYV